MHDPRIGRFFAVDPLAPQYPHNSPYAFSENRLLDCVELEGKEAYWIHGTKKAWGFNWSDEVHSGQMKYSNISRIGKVFGNTKFNNSFNWNGANNDEDRQKAGQKLAKHIVATRAKLIEDKKIEANEPITLIGHSHGGNVAIIAANILIDEFGYSAEQINIVALNTPREHDVTLWHSDVNLYSVNARNDLVQKLGGDGSTTEGSSDGPIYVLNADEKIMYNDQLKTDIITIPTGFFPFIWKDVETNHNGWHTKNIDQWLPLLKAKI